MTGALIPKTIHYCWFGSASLPELHARCVESWARHAADFEIVRWSEANTAFDTPFLRWAVDKGHWAFVSDYIRMRAVHQYGGIYLDADMELVRDPSPLLTNACFLGRESADRPTTGVLGAVPGHAFPKTCMQIIDRRFMGKQPYLIAPEVASQALSQPLPDDVRVYDEEYFYPYNPYDPARYGRAFMYSDVTANTVAIHHWAKGWKVGLGTRIWRKLAG